MAALATVLRGIGRIHGDICPTSICCFVGHKRHELYPCGIQNAFGETVVMHHSIDEHILDSDEPKAIDQRAGFLVTEVTATVSDALMNPCHDLAMFGPLWRTFLRCFQLALNALQVLLVTPEELRTGRLVAGRER